MSSRLLRYALGCVLSLLALSSGYAAEAPITPGADPASRNLNRNQQSRLLDEQARRLDALQQLPGDRDAVTPSPVPESNHCFLIDAVHLEGMTLLDLDTRRQLLLPVIDHCVALDDLNELLRHITQTYVDRGYITSRAYLPPQDLSGGQLRVVIAEGRIESIEGQEGHPSARELQMSAPTEAGEHLNLRALEQMIDQLNRLPSRQSTLQMLPGDEIGGSRVQVETQAQKPWRVSLSRNNDGDESTGEQQWGIGLDIDSPLGLAGQLVTRFGEDASGNHEHRSGNQYLAYSLPYGWWTFSYSYSKSDYRSHAEANGFFFRLDGASELHQLQAERLLWRDSVSKTSTSLGLSRIATRNYIDHSRIDVSSQQLSELALGINHGRRLGSALINIDAGWQKGLTLMGAQHDDDATPGAPQAQYDKTTLTLSYLQPFEIRDQHFRFLSLANAQHSDDVLYSPVRLSLGGASSVRGFKNQTLSGDSGAYWRNQISWLHPLEGPLAQPLFNNLDLTLAYDQGVIESTHYTDGLSGRMTGWAAEVGLSGQHLAVHAGFAHSLKRPQAFPERETPIYLSADLYF